MQPRPEAARSQEARILMPADVDLLERANRGELPCPGCGQPLMAALSPRLDTETYQTDGILLFCPCGFREM